jgi:hypothetical protein
MLKHSINRCDYYGGVTAYVIKSLLVYVCRTVRNLTSPVSNSAADMHQQGPDNICSHTTILTAPMYFNPLNAELNPIYHLLALLGAHHILHVGRIRVKMTVLTL